MRKRVLELMGVAALIAVVSMISVNAQIRGDVPQNRTGPAPKTSWGEPSLEGTWTEAYQTPLQRPAKYKDKATFTEEDRRELDIIRGRMPGNETRSVRGTELDVAGAYNDVYSQRKPTGTRTSLIVDPPDGRIPPVTPEVRERRAFLQAWALSTMEATATCKNKWPGCEGGKYTGVRSPRMDEPYKYYPNTRLNRMDHVEDHGGMGTRCLGGDMRGAGGLRQIVQSPGAISITYDVGQGQGFQRVVNIDGSSHLPANVRTWWGDSRAKWEGNTLVIDITNFNGKVDFQGSLQNLHMIERWTRTGPDTIELVTTWEDPTSWTKPWTTKQELNYLGDGYNKAWKEPRCMEGNFAMIGMLYGARMAEKAFAEGRGPDPATMNNATPTGSANTLGIANDEEESDPLN
jgi:hypothetical protein